MVVTDEAALRCDFAEVYHILDYRALPARQAALFACGLGEGSRIVRRLTGQHATPEQLLLAMIADAVRILVWMQTEDGAKGRNRPSLISERLTGGTGRGGVGFDTADDFNAWRNAMLGGETSA